MGDVINLRRARKDRQKAEAAAQADANRARHGRTRSERTAIEAEADRLRRTLDGAALVGVSARDGEPCE